MEKKSTGTSSIGSKDAESQTKKSSATSFPTSGSASSTSETTSKTGEFKTDSTNETDNVEIEALLRKDHRKVEQLFKEYESAKNSEDKKRLSKQICMELIVHTMLEEELFYPACRAQGVEDDMLDEAQVEHDGAKILITELITSSVDSAFYDAKVKVLSEYIKHHVGEEEKPGDGIFAKARSAGVDMTTLGKHLQLFKKDLLAEGERCILQPPVPRSLDLEPNFSNRKEYQTMRNMQQNRDEQGRFTSEDDNYGRSGGRSSRFDQDYDDNYSSGRGRSNRNDDFYDDDDRSFGNRGGRGGGGQNQGQGWFGDSEAHSEAARRGWQSQGRGGRSDYDDDEYRYSGSRGGRGGYQGGNGGQGQGWFGDFEGHSEASQRGWQSPGRGRNDEFYDDEYGSSGNRGGRGGNGGQGQGWFGDSEGHSEASRRGWQSSGRNSQSYDDDDYGSSSRGGRQGGRQSQSSGQQGHSGWFGDPEGHSKAARRGWKNR